MFLSQDAIPADQRCLLAMLANFEDPHVGAVYGRQVTRPDSSLERHDVLDAIYGENRRVKDPAHRNAMGYRAGRAQVNGWRGDTSITQRVEYDLYYLRNWSLTFDLEMVTLTCLRLFHSKNAH